MLTVQYRMHKDISDWSSKAMYHGKLVPADSVAQWTLKDLPNVTCNTNLSTDDNELINNTLLLIDTAGCDMEESVLPSGSRYNEGEASIVQNHGK
jgi:superfamily I DNA and/or RNA helicase